MDELCEQIVHRKYPDEKRFTFFKSRSFAGELLHLRIFTTIRNLQNWISNKKLKFFNANSQVYQGDQLRLLFVYLWTRSAQTPSSLLWVTDPARSEERERFTWSNSNSVLETAVAGSLQTVKRSSSHPSTHTLYKLAHLLRCFSSLPKFGTQTNSISIRRFEAFRLF